MFFGDCATGPAARGAKKKTEAFNVIESAISGLCSVSVSLSCGVVALSYCALWFPYAFLPLPFLAFLCTCVKRCLSLACAYLTI